MRIRHRSINQSSIAAKGDEFLPMNGGDVTARDFREGLTTNCKYRKAREHHWLARRIFILTWIRSYDREKAVSDLIAGITLGLTIIPQSIAYAALAGLSSEYGLYSAFIGK